GWLVAALTGHGVVLRGYHVHFETRSPRGRLMLTRRSFLLGSLGAALPVEKDSPLVTLTDWLSADRRRREAELTACLDRIKSTDSTIHAGKQVLPQKATGRGALDAVPFGAKDIIETRGLATEYGSPIYAGRKGTTDAAIVQFLRRRG